MYSIKARREQLKLSQEEVANKIGVTKATVSKWEKGDIENMKRDKIAKLSKVLNISPLILLGIEDQSTENVVNIPTSSYNYFDTGISAGVLTEVDPFFSKDIEQISLSDIVLGKYAGDKDLFITHINGESMSNVLPNHSLIAIKKFTSINDLQDGDIVLFQDGGEMSVKEFYFNRDSNIITFSPNSKKQKEFKPISYRIEDIETISIIGKVVVYIVEV